MSWLWLRRRVIERDDGVCQYCGRHEFVLKHAIHVDHVIPFSRGGPTRMDNLVTACRDCNLKKHASVHPFWLHRLHEQQREIADWWAALNDGLDVEREIEAEAYRFDTFYEALA